MVENEPWIIMVIYKNQSQKIKHILLKNNVTKISEGATLNKN